MKINILKYQINLITKAFEVALSRFYRHLPSSLELIFSFILLRNLNCIDKINMLL